MNAIPNPLDVDHLVIGYGRGGTTLAARLGRLRREQQAVERGHRILVAKKPVAQIVGMPRAKIVAEKRDSVAPW
jgi:choline dehydrogenase-like flavoprotein